MQTLVIHSVHGGMHTYLYISQSVYFHQYLAMWENWSCLQSVRELKSMHFIVRISLITYVDKTAMDK